MCCTTYWCALPSLLCCVPHTLAGMSRKIGFRGFAKNANSSYKTNRKVVFYGITLSLVVFAVFYIGLIFTPVYYHRQKGASAVSNSTSSAVSHDENPTTTTTASSVVLFALIATPFMIFVSVFSMLYIYYLVLLRNRMRQAFNIKPTLFTCCGEVGGFFEDAFCMTNCFSCAISQMANETDVAQEICGGTDPGYVDVNVV